MSQSLAEGKSFRDLNFDAAAIRRALARKDIGSHMDEYAKVMAIANGPKNLRLLESSFNASKGARSAEQWMSTAMGSTVSKRYLRDTAKIQREVARDIEKIIGKSDDLRHFLNQKIR